MASWIRSRLQRRVGAVDRRGRCSAQRCRPSAAPTTRASLIDKKMGGWDQVRPRLTGDEEGAPMLYVFSTCLHLIRTLPVMQHDEHNPEDLDTDGEDHAADELRYACMSRPFLANVVKAEDRNPLLVRNAFRLPN